MASVIVYFFVIYVWRLVPFEIGWWHYENIILVIVLLVLLNFDFIIDSLFRNNKAKP
jgi:hypothetical protein